MGNPFGAGGNNAMIITENADLEIAIPGAVFGAVGTVRQRCTSTRRLLVHENKFEDMKSKLIHAYQQIAIGNPLDKHNHMGLPIDQEAVKVAESALMKINAEVGK